MAIITFVLGLIALLISIKGLIEVTNFEYTVREWIYTLKNKINPPQEMTEDEYKEMWRNYKK